MCIVLLLAVSKLRLHEAIGAVSVGLKVNFTRQEYLRSENKKRTLVAPKIKRNRAAHPTKNSGITPPRITLIPGKWGNHIVYLETV